MLFIICRLHNTRGFSVTPRPPGQRATVTDLKYTFKMPHHKLSVIDSQYVNAHLEEPEERRKEGKETRGQSRPPQEHLR